MRYFLLAAALFLGLTSCDNKKEGGEFRISGNISNAADQQIYLDRIFFSDVAPEVLDTAEIKAGKFEMQGKSPEEGLFRLRFEKSDKVMFFINDGSKISLSADLAGNDISSQKFSGKANAMLNGLLQGIDSRQQELMSLNEKVQQLQKDGNDSLLTIESTLLQNKATAFKNYILNAIDSMSHPVVCMFALGFTTGIDPAELKGPIAGLQKRFPKHEGVNVLVEQYKKMMEVQSQAASGPAVGSEAPDFTMNDENGSAVSLKSFRGKFVLVDFWASWCGPCRRENPNVVSAYNNFKDKNFTILGVSLDEDREKWLTAIRNDKLSWKQVSELKGWNTSVVSLYRFEGIPYNVLIDPQGKIIATGLRGAQLEEKLAEVLK